MLIYRYSLIFPFTSLANARDREHCEGNERKKESTDDTMATVNNIRVFERKLFNNVDLLPPTTFPSTAAAVAVTTSTGDYTLTTTQHSGGAVAREN